MLLNKQRENGGSKISYIFLSIVKIIDSMISTAKTISLSKGNATIAAGLTVIAQFLFYFVVTSIINDKSLQSVIVVAVSAGIGSYLTSKISDKICSDKLFVNIITSKDRADMKVLCDYLRSQKIRLITLNSYNKDLDITLTALVFANTRHQSKVIDKYIHNNANLYLREIID